jgi:hypothetical protein
MEFALRMPAFPADRGELLVQCSTSFFFLPSPVHSVWRSRCEAMANIEQVAPQAGYTDDHAGMTEKGRAVRTLVEADLLDDRYETTQRGLKSRHVQLMALGGTIGTG